MKKALSVRRCIIVFRIIKKFTKSGFGNGVIIRKIAESFVITKADFFQAVCFDDFDGAVSANDFCSLSGPDQRACIDTVKRNSF